MYAPFLSCFQFPCTQAVKKRNTDDDPDAPGGSSSTTQSSAPKPVSGGGLLAPPKGMLSPPPAKGPFAAPSTAHTTRTPSATSSSSGFDDFGSFTSRYVGPHALHNLCVDHISLPMCTTLTVIPSRATRARTTTATTTATTAAACSASGRGPAIPSGLTRLGPIRLAAHL
jgi:hypothetical protein